MGLPTLLLTPSAGTVSDQLLLQREEGHPTSPMCHPPSVYTAVAGSEGSQCNDEQVQVTSG